MRAIGRRSVRTPSICSKSLFTKPSVHGPPRPNTTNYYAKQYFAQASCRFMNLRFPAMATGATPDPTTPGALEPASTTGPDRGRRPASCSLEGSGCSRPSRDRRWRARKRREAAVAMLLVLAVINFSFGHQVRDVLLLGLIGNLSEPNENEIVLVARRRRRASTPAVS